MNYGYLDHSSDIGFEGRGETIEVAFEQGAMALFNLMAELDQIQQSNSTTIEIGGETLEELYYEWLSELLSLSNLNGEIFSKFSIDKLQQVQRNEFHLKGTAWGEKIDLSKHNLGTEVKAITYMGLKVDQADGHWRARCVVDV